MKDLDQLPSSQMSASARIDELISLLTCALIRTFVSSDAGLAACQAETISKVASDKGGGNGGERSPDCDRGHDLSNDQPSSSA